MNNKSSLSVFVNENNALLRKCIFHFRGLSQQLQIDLVSKLTNYSESTKWIWIWILFEREKNTLKVNWALHNWQIAERLGGKVSWLAHLDRWGAKHRSSDFFSSSKGWDELKANRFYKTQSQFRHIMSDQHGSYETDRISPNLLFKGNMCLRKNQKPNNDVKLRREGLQGC